MRRWLENQFGTGARRWHHDPNGITKWAMLSDGEVLTLLTGGGDEALVEKVYGELKDVNQSYGQALGYLVFAYSLVAIAVFNVTDELDLLGMKFKAALMPHVAMVVVTLATLRLSAQYTRLSAQRSWFAALFKRSDPYARARLLLRYPQAFPTTQFVRSTRGFPAHVFPAKAARFEMLGLFGYLGALVIFLPVPFFISVAALQQIWLSDQPSRLLARGLVVALVVAGGGMLANPVYSDLRRRYIHYGMSNLLAQLPDERRAARISRIIKASASDGEKPEA